MKKTTLLVAMLSLAFAVLAEDKNTQPTFSMPPGMKGAYGTEQAKVLTVFSAEEDGGRFRAYHIKWKEQDVVVSDMFGTTDYKKGDSITFMVQNIEVPAAGKKMKMLKFMLMDTSAFMPKIESSNKAIDSDKK